MGLVQKLNIFLWFLRGLICGLFKIVNRPLTERVGCQLQLRMTIIKCDDEMQHSLCNFFIC